MPLTAIHSKLGIWMPAKACLCSILLSPHLCFHILARCLAGFQLDSQLLALCVFGCLQLLVCHIFGCHLGFCLSQLILQNHTCTDVLAVHESHAYAHVGMHHAGPHTSATSCLQLVCRQTHTLSCFCASTSHAPAALQYQLPEHG